MQTTNPLIGTYTSKSTLMHACLAHLSPQIRTMDSIIRASPRISAPHTVALPTEILLLIREWLFPLIKTQLVQQSTVALEAYEHSLRNLLCPDCIVYNLDIYGPNVWQWEHFRGPCSCLETLNPPRTGLEQPPTPIALTRRTHNNPKPFRDAQHWLGTHLSKEAAALGVQFVRSRGDQKQSTAAAHFDLETAASNNGTTASFEFIWDVVAFVLREYNCEFIRETEDELTTAATRFCTVNMTLSRCDTVQIIPSIIMPIDTEVPDLATRAKIWRIEGILDRVVRDLCLESVEPFGAHQRDPSSFKRLLWRSNPPILHDQDHIQVLFGIIASLVAGCVSFPVTCTTIAFSVFCFYSRPKSFRLF